MAHIDVRSPVEPDLHGTDTLLGKGFDMLDVGGRTDRLLDGIDDTLFDIQRRSALINDAHEGDGHLDIGEEIDRQSLQGCHAEHDHRQRQH
jgi:hypothetical protein